MNAPSLVDRLAALTALQDIPRDQLQWLVDHGEFHRFGDGATFFGDDRDFAGLFLLISGRFSVRVDQDGVVREVREITPGRITGHLPYSRMTTPRGHLVADGPVEFLVIRKDDIREMTRECYEFTASCVHEMLDRVRVFKADDKHQEKMAALGRLSAGLAHELNNPATAVARAADELDARRDEVVASARALGAARLPDASARAVEALEASARRSLDEGPSPLDRADIEDGIVEWLQERDLDPDLAFPLAQSGVTVADLDGAASDLDEEGLAAAVRFVAADGIVRGLTADISSAAARIHSLVAAVKKHTHMDRAPTVEAIALANHLEDVVALMSSKASEFGITLDLTVEAGLPAVEGSVGDLNQVWMHLIDNAIDAVAGSGRINIDAANAPEGVVVRVLDDGPGIPVEDQERVFDPFFTTKDVGRGRGLGLDIVQTVVRSHRGTVDLISRPGRTEFRVTLPRAASPVTHA